MDLKIDPEINTRFPELNVITISINGLKIKKSDIKLEDFKQIVIQHIKKEYTLESVKNHPTFKAYRKFFWTIGIDPTKIRPAAEALTRRILAGKNLPCINTLVDAYNLASLKTKIPLATFDRDKLDGKLLMKFAKEGEQMIGIGMDKPFVMKGGEIVISDEKKLIAVYPYRDADNTKVTEKTEKVSIIVCGVPNISKETLVTASEVTIDYISRFCK